MVKVFESRHVYTEKEKAKIVKLWAHGLGMTPTQLAERFDTTVGCINGVLHRNKERK